MEGAEWSNFNATVCVNEEADFMAQLFPNPNDVNLNYTHNYQIMANNKDINEDGSSYFSCDSISNTQNLYPYSHDSCYDHRRNNHHDHDHDHDDVHHYHNDCFNDDDNHHHHHLASPSLPIDFLQCHMEGHENNNNNNNNNSSDNNNNEDHSEMDNGVAEDNNKISSTSSCKNAKKRPRSLEVQRGKKNIKVKRSRSNLSLGGGDNEEEEEKDGNKSCSSGSLEDDCSSKGGTTASTTNTTTTNTKAVNSNGKTRASRGSATDPQSLYARKRRERINERLKILQSLVPNGTKVDISTMLEEAVQYVKFLQLQIKLLSSDEHWMYAPIAYNGMNIGLDFKINLPR